MPLLRGYLSSWVGITILFLILFPLGMHASGFSESVTALRGTSSTPLPDAINAVATAFLVLTTTLALIVIVLAGVQYMLSQGDEEKVETAKKTLVGAVMGLLVIGLSGAGVNCVLNMINGRGCGGGGTTTTSVAVRTGGDRLRTQTVADDEGGGFDDDVFEDSGENGGGGGSQFLANNAPICAIDQTCATVCGELSAYGRNYCAFNVSFWTSLPTRTCCLGAALVATELCALACHGSDLSGSKEDLPAGRTAFYTTLDVGYALCRRDSSTTRAEIEKQASAAMNPRQEDPNIQRGWRGIIKRFGTDWPKRLKDVCAFLLNISYSNLSAKNPAEAGLEAARVAEELAKILKCDIHYPDLRNQCRGASPAPEPSQPAWKTSPPPVRRPPPIVRPYDPNNPPPVRRPPR